jgi:hypothetical protein
MERNEARRIDEKLAEIYQRDAAHRADIAGAERTVRKYGAEHHFAKGCDARIAKAQAAREALAAEAAPLVAAYRSAPWSRFFLVDGNNGHVHSSMSCSTCFPTTSYGWLPELSGASEDEAVEEFGEKMCSICFTSAPTDPRCSRPGRRDRAAIEARAAEKAAKAAKKAEKAAASKLRGLIATAVEGRIDARLVARGAYSIENAFTRQQIEKGQEAERVLAAEYGIDPAEIEKKTSAKWRREGW